MSEISVQKFITITLLVYGVQTFQIRSLKAHEKDEHAGFVNLDNAVSQTHAQSLMACFYECLKNTKCLTFFYNLETERCVIHSKDFSFVPPDTQEDGWRHYITEDATGRCPSPNNMYRHLDFCYHVQQSRLVDFDAIKSACTNNDSRLSTIRSQQFQDYFSHVLNGRPHNIVCLDGTVISDSKVTLADGTQLSYFNWESGQPAVDSEHCLVMLRDDKWHDFECQKHDTQCNFICEKV